MADILGLNLFKLHFLFHKKIRLAFWISCYDFKKFFHAKKNCYELLHFPILKIVGMTEFL
jgi:hypothetical protein